MWENHKYTNSQSFRDWCTIKWTEGQKRDITKEIRKYFKIMKAKIWKILSWSLKKNLEYIISQLKRKKDGNSWS